MESFTIERQMKKAQKISYEQLEKVPMKIGVYTAWLKKSNRCLYVGKSLKLYNRIRSHFSGRRGGDQFCLYVYDKYIHPDRPNNISTPEINNLTGDWIKKKVNFRWILAPKQKINEFEKILRKKLRPILNPIE